MTKSEFRALCDKHQEGEYAEGFDIYNLLADLEDCGEGDWEDLNSHDSVKEWFKHCIEQEWWMIWKVIKEWGEEQFAEFYKIDFSMGALAHVTALATADDFYEAFKDRFDDNPEEDGFYDIHENWDPIKKEEE